jgi:hypothetical protein
MVPDGGLKIGIGGHLAVPPSYTTAHRQIHQIIQQDAKAASDTSHFQIHPEDPVSGARGRTTADEDTAASTDGGVG